jgi:hypothetical protein
MALLDDPCDFSCPLFRVVILHQGARVQKRAALLALIALGDHDVRHRTPNLRQGLAYLL